MMISERGVGGSFLTFMERGFLQEANVIVDYREDIASKKSFTQPISYLAVVI